MVDYIQTLMALVGSLGFAIFMKMKGKQIFFAGVGGALTWGMYLMYMHILGQVFISVLLASIFAGIYAEIMARVNKAPATIFLTAGSVPLIPGGSLYYSMLGLITRDEAAFEQNGINAVNIALAISLGFMLVTIGNRFLSRLKTSHKK